MVNLSDRRRLIFQGAVDFDLELIESIRFDNSIQPLVYRPTDHV